MDEGHRTYRIRTKVGEEAPNVINVPLNQTFDMFEILSLKLNQKNVYKTYESSQGIIVGRVYANGGVGEKKKKISVFVQVESNETWMNKFIYNYTSTSTLDSDGVRYNLLPDSSEDACHQVVGTFPNKRLVLDNDNVIEIFDKYWKYTTVTNKAGDYMLFGVPTGSQTLHVDVDLSDCGILTQRPRDFIGQGYNEKMFESPNKFKKSNNLNSLAQIYSQDKSVFVYPYWGDTSESEDNISITRCDISLTYEFKPTCVFLGSIVTDKGTNAIGKNCTAKKNAGNMEQLSTGEGNIEMIRKTLNGKVESFSIDGNRLIDGDGVWCYQIPMNLDYITTNEEGKMVPTDNPTKGIATRAKVRFRISLDDNPNDDNPNKRCKFLVPNNPRLNKKDYPVFYDMEEKKADYEFGTKTLDESFVNLFWNNVYTVKSYIPRLQKDQNHRNKKHTGIKQIKYFGDNNPMPFNGLDIKLSFTNRIICVLTKLFIQLIAFINFSLALLSYVPCKICKLLTKLLKPISVLKKVPVIGRLAKAVLRPFEGIRDVMCAIVLDCISLSSEFCEDESGIKRTYYPGCRIGGAIGKALDLDCVWDKTKEDHDKKQGSLDEEERTEADYRPNFVFESGGKSTLYTCVENALAQENQATSFKFQNDWMNGVLYAPLWYRRIRPKRRYLFGLFTRKAKDQWCRESGEFGLKYFQANSLQRNAYEETFDSYYDNNKKITPYVYPELNKKKNGCGKENDKCFNSHASIPMKTGLIVDKETILGQTVYYYKSINYVVGPDVIDDNEFDKDVKGTVQLLYATDIVLLGSLNDCDLHGLPQFFKSLVSTTYNMPSDLEFVDTDFTFDLDPDDGGPIVSTRVITEETGADWGNLNQSDQCGHMGEDDDGGLFYDIGCSSYFTRPKTDINMRRICEFGVVLDSAKFIPNLEKLQSSEDNDDTDEVGTLRPDGYISYDELQLSDERSMFATMNGNHLRVKYNEETSFYEYDFRYLYCDNFDAALYNIMQQRLKKCNGYTYRNNDKLEKFSFDYYIFRLGDRPYFYDTLHKFARYENSFYFYFGLKSGKTAIEKFYSKYFAECEDEDMVENPLIVTPTPNDWCSEVGENPVLDGNVKFDFRGLTPPFDITIYDDMDGQIKWSTEERDKRVEHEKFYFGDESADFGDFVYEDDMKLKNGDYILVITDSDGETGNVRFTLKPKYLYYSTTETDFEIDNDILEIMFGSDPNIAKADIGTVVTDEETYISQRYHDGEELGGLITIYGIYNKFEQMTEDFKIEIEPVDEEKYKFNEPFSTLIIPPSTIPENVKVLQDSNGVFIYVVGVPKGDVNYRITVTQTCDGIDSNNSVSKLEKVRQPIPVRLYIDDVDSDLIQDFNTGWVIGGGNVLSRDVSFSPNIGSLYGWDEISNIWGTDCTDYSKIYEHVYEEDADGLLVPVAAFEEILEKLHSEKVCNSPYHYCNEYITKFTMDKYNALTKYSDKERALLEIDEVYRLRNELPNLMRQAFYMVCPSSPMVLRFKLQTGHLTVSYGVNYPEDFMPENTESTDVLLKRGGGKVCTRNYTTDNEVHDIWMPTLTYPDSPAFGTTEPPYINFEKMLSFARTYVYGEEKNKYDEASENEHKIYKTPFLVGACDRKGTEKPDNIEVVKVNDRYNVNGLQPQVYRAFHIIDKIITMEKLVWSYFDAIPYYKRGNPYDGEFINMFGILTAKVYNGIAESLEYDFTQFREQVYAQYNVLLKRLIPDTEDSLPTRRIVLGLDEGQIIEPTLQRDFYYPFKWYWVYDASLINPIGIESPNIQYAPVFKLDDKFSLIELKNCSPDEDQSVEGTFKIILNEGSYNNPCDKGLNHLSLSTTSDDILGTTFFVYSTELVPYPLNIVTRDEEEYKDFVSESHQIYEEWNGANPEDIFSFATKKDTLKDVAEEKAGTYFQSRYVNEEYDIDTTKNGWGNTGEFVIGSLSPYSKFTKQLFVVAVTEDNTRAISPILDFCKVEATIAFGIVHRIRFNAETGTYEIIPVDEEPESGGGSGEGGEGGEGQVIATKYGIGVTIHNMRETYYFNWYSFKIYFVTEILGVKMMEEAQVAHTLIYNIIDDKKKEVEKFFKSKKDEVVKLSSVIATDITGLRHYCCLDEDWIINDTNFFQIAWDLNNENATWQSGGNKPKIGTYMEGADVIHAPDVVSSDIQKCFRGWSTNPSATQGDTKPYVENLNEGNWASHLVFYAVWTEDCGNKDGGGGDTPIPPTPPEPSGDNVRVTFNVRQNNGKWYS